MSRITAIIVAALAVTVAFVASPASASDYFDDPPTDEVVIDIATVNGSGCSPGTAAVAVSPDNTAFTVTYSEYLAQVGGSSNPIDFRKNCQLNLVVHVPQGFTYGIARADYRGFAHLAEGANALQKAQFYFQGMPETTSSEHTLDGFFSDNWQFSDEIEFGQIVFKPCGEERNFNINTELRANLGTSDPDETSFITMDSTDGNVETIFHFSWKKCPQD